MNNGGDGGSCTSLPTANPRLNVPPTYDTLPTSKGATPPVAAASSANQQTFTWSTPFFDLQFVDIRTKKGNVGISKRRYSLALMSR